MYATEKSSEICMYSSESNNTRNIQNINNNKNDENNKFFCLICPYPLDIAAPSHSYTSLNEGKNYYKKWRKTCPYYLILLVL